MGDIDLARRAVAAKGWRWMDGIREQYGRRGRGRAALDGGWWWWDGTHWRPADSEEDALRLALAAWPAVTS